MLISAPVGLFKVDFIAINRAFFGEDVIDLVFRPSPLQLKEKRPPILHGSREDFHGNSNAMNLRIPANFLVVKMSDQDFSLQIDRSPSFIYPHLLLVFLIEMMMVEECEFGPDVFLISESIVILNLIFMNVLFFKNICEIQPSISLERADGYRFSTSKAASSSVSFPAASWGESTHPSSSQ